MKSSELIHRYLIGAASAEEVRELERRLQCDEPLQDEYLLQAELDAHIRQQVQTSLMEDVKPKPAASPSASPSASSPSSMHVWKWVSGISTLAATILLVLLTLDYPQPKTAMAYPSLGKLTAVVSRSERSIWAAAATGDLLMLQAELKRGVAIDARSEDAITPLHFAALFGHSTAAELLLSLNADVTLTDEAGNTALHMAVFLGRSNVVRVLLAHGADPLSRNDAGFSSLDIAAAPWSDHYEEHLRQAEAEMGFPLDMKRIRGERSTVLKLLSAANREAGDTTPTISIWQAAMTGNTAAVRQHIDAGADLNAQEDVGGSTPLILTAIFGHPEVAKLLIDAGADLELRNHSGGTAIHLASFFCQPAVVELLLQAGADPNKTNNQNLTPLDVVTIELDAELQAVYRYVYDSLDLKLDIGHIKDTRLHVADILRRQQADSPKAPHTVQEREAVK